MHFEVDRNDYRRSRLVESEPPDDLDDGQILLRVERFAFTANNISYALSGDMLGYWNFFPTEDPWGRLPVMGVAEVMGSHQPAVAEGARYFGFYPMATHLVVEAEPRPDGFIDSVAHRREHAAAYRGYTDVGHDPFFVPDMVDRTLLLRGLFTTSFLADDFLAEQGHLGADTVVITSASSKTSIALAHCLAARDGVSGIGLTSAGNKSFVEGVGLYDEVVTYDDIESLSPSDAVVVDMAGNGAVLGRIHSHYGDRLRHSLQIGATHWEDTGRQSDLPGPTPEFFFAPAQMAKRSSDWGHDDYTRRIDDGLKGFLDDSSRWLTVDHRRGPEAVVAAHAAMIDGLVPPDLGLILSMHEH